MAELLTTRARVNCMRLGITDKGRILDLDEKAYYSFRAPRQLIEQFDRLAEKAGLSREALLRLVIVNACEDL